MDIRFLSEEHLAAATASMAQDADITGRAAGVELGINYLITDGPEGDFVYHIQVTNGTASMARGELVNPDASFQSSYATAARVSRGETTSQMAVMTGKIRVKGSVGTIMKNTALLGLIEAATDSVDTAY